MLFTFIPAMDSKKIILYDGECNLCIRSVKFISARDSDRIFNAVALQSEEGKKFAEKWGLDTTAPHSVILLEGDEASERSEAGLRIMGSLKGTRFLARIMRHLPGRFNDALYNFIARHRFRIFGRKKTRSNQG
jgi:predicted DCC family thiol-disulfide oxidoreductase YuxK